jgi:hypothetical protein
MRSLPRKAIYAGRLRLQVLPDRKMDILTGFVKNNVAPKATILRVRLLRVDGKRTPSFTST